MDGVARPAGGLRPLWTCPRCGHQFITVHMWHSCSDHTVDEHFAGRPAALRATFDLCVLTLEEVGPVTVIAQKSRIVVMVRVRFNGAIVRQRWMDYSIALRREIAHPALRGVIWYTPSWASHTFRLSDPGDVDPLIKTYLRESYAVGAQVGGTGPGRSAG